MESHFEWPDEVDLRCAPLGPRKKELISSGKLLWAPASSWISELRCAPLTQTSISKNRSEKKIMSNGTAQRSAPRASRTLFGQLFRAEVCFLVGETEWNKKKHDACCRRVAHPRFCGNGVTTECLLPVTRLRKHGIARNVFRE